MFHEIKVAEIDKNPFSLIGEQWMLVTAGDETKCNTMTASWGTMGVFFNKNIVTVYVRPQRYTYEFIEKTGKFTLSFLPDSYRKTLMMLGTKSGRDSDKMAESGLTVAMAGENYPYFKEAELVLSCKILYKQDFVGEGMEVPELDAKYFANKDYHRMYMAEIETVLVK